MAAIEGPSATAEAANAPAPQSASDKAADFEKYLFDGDEEQEETPSDEGDGEEPELEVEEEADEEEGEPEPAIAPPVSLNAEEKAAFLSAPPEAQKVWAASEARRNAQVQEATTKASHAQRDAESRAAAADAEAKRVYADQMQKFVSAFEPAMPDTQLAYSDPARYIAEKAQYDAMKAQHDDLVQQIGGVKQEAETQEQQAFIAQRDRELLGIPEIANPETREATLQRALNTAEAMGYDVDQLARFGDGRDFKALLVVAELRAKADKYDQAMAKQMQRVRAQKGKTLKPNAAPHADARAARSDQSWQRVTGARSKEAQAEAFADWVGL